MAHEKANSCVLHPRGCYCLCDVNFIIWWSTVCPSSAAQKVNTHPTMMLIVNWMLILCTLCTVFSILGLLLVQRLQKFCKTFSSTHMWKVRTHTTDCIMYPSASASTACRSAAAVPVRIHPGQNKQTYVQTYKQTQTEKVAFFVKTALHL